MVWEIVNEGKKLKDEIDELKFNISTLNVACSRKLEKFVNEKMQDVGIKKKTVTKKDPTEEL